MIEQILDFARIRLGGGLELVFAPSICARSPIDRRRVASGASLRDDSLQCPSCAALGIGPPRAGAFEPDRQRARPRRSGQAGHGNRGRRGPPRVGRGAQRRPTHSARASVRALRPVPQGRARRAGARRGSASVSTSRTKWSSGTEGRSRFDQPQPKERRFESSCRAKPSATPAIREASHEPHRTRGRG